MVVAHLIHHDMRSGRGLDKDQLKISFQMPHEQSLKKFKYIFFSIRILNIGFIMRMICYE